MLARMGSSVPVCTRLPERGSSAREPLPTQACVASPPGPAPAWPAGSGLPLSRPSPRAVASPAKWCRLGCEGPTPGLRETPAEEEGDVRRNEGGVLPENSTSVRKAGRPIGLCHGFVPAAGRGRARRGEHWARRGHHAAGTGRPASVRTLALAAVGPPPRGGPSPAWARPSLPGLLLHPA